MTLPEQMTGEALRSRLADYERRLSALAVRPSEPIAQAHAASGGRILHDVRGYVSVAPDARRRWRGSFRSRYPVVEVEYRFAGPAPRGAFHVRSTPAVLTHVDGAPIDEAFLQAPTRVHSFKIGRIAASVRLRFIAYTERLVLAPIEEGLPVRPDLNRYEIPSAATAIYGEGLVRYATGQRVAVFPEVPYPLLRAEVNGSLAAKEGGVYAEFEGYEPAFCKIGSVWVPTPILE